MLDLNLARHGMFRSMADLVIQTSLQSRQNFQDCRDLIARLKQPPSRSERISDTLGKVFERSGRLAHAQEGF